MSRDRSGSGPASQDWSDDPIWVDEDITPPARAAEVDRPLRPRTVKPPDKTTDRMKRARRAALEADRQRRIPTGSAGDPRRPETSPASDRRSGHPGPPAARTPVRGTSPSTRQAADVRSTVSARHIDGERAAAEPRAATSRSRGRGAVIGTIVVVLLALAGVGAWGFLGAGEDRADAESATAPATTPPTTAAASTSPPTTAAEAAPPPVLEPITIAFAGDIYGEALPKDGFVAGMSERLAPMAQLLSDADLTIANLETAITERGTPYDKQFTFRAPREILDVIALSGIDIVSMANNHGLDFGPDGLEDSLAAKATSPIPVIGIGANEDEAFAPARVEIKGRRIAVIGATQVIGDSAIPLWTAGPDQAGLASAKREDRLVEEVRRARVDSDVLIVFLHWGIEKDLCPSDDQQHLAQLLRDAGADIIVGTHAHRVQGGGYLGRSAVHYGLGNFAFYAKTEDSAQTGVLTITVGSDGDLDQTWHPGRIDEFTPVPLEGAAAEAELARWNDLRSCTNLTAEPTDADGIAPGP